MVELALVVINKDALNMFSIIEHNPLPQKLTLFSLKTRSGNGVILIPLLIAYFKNTNVGLLQVKKRPKSDWIKIYQLF